MKKLLGIVVLGLLWCDVGLAKTIVKLPKDTSSGFKKVHKSLTGKYYKDYGMQVVDKKDGHPVRSGDKSIRFEVRSGDCGSDPDGWSDCKNDRERHELTVGGKKDLMSKGEYWFSWSVYFPEDHQNLYIRIYNLQVQYLDLFLNTQVLFLHLLLFYLVYHILDLILE